MKMRLMIKRRSHLHHLAGQRRDLNSVLSVSPHPVVKVVRVTTDDLTGRVVKYALFVSKA
jgi:hypothetical protein